MSRFALSENRHPFSLVLGIATLALSMAPAMAQSEDEPEDQELRLGDAAYERVEQQANVFTSSRQDAVALERDEAGNTIVVWQSRRQEGGTYGIYARRFDPSGEPTGGEVHVNATTRGMQMQPAVALDPSGAAWFAWRSFGQDGHEGGIVARRFDPSFETATRETLVNELTDGHQSDVSLAATPAGGSIVVWTSPSPTSDRREIHARRLAPSGEPAGPAFRVDQGGDVENRLPAVATDAGGAAVVTWARTEANGIPAGIYARRIDADGEFEGAELRVDEPAPVHAIEPSLTVGADGDFVVAWMETQGDGYSIRLRSFHVGGDELEKGPVRTVETGSPGNSSGMTVSRSETGGYLVAWSRYGDGWKEEAGLFARVFDEEGEAKTETFRVTEHVEGPQALANGRGTKRALLHADGRMAFAWHGDAGNGDTSAANLTLLNPAELELPERKTVAAAELPRFAPLEEGATPHDPPTFDPRDKTRRPDEALDPVGPGTDFDFLAITNTGWTPPDPHMAVGPNHVVVMTNGAIAYFQKDGTFLFQDEIEDSFGFWGSVGATDFVFDPEVIFDPHSQRFMAMASERGNDGQPYFLLAISDDTNPVGTWHKYRINVFSAITDTDIDSPNIAVDEDAIYLTADFFGPDKYLVYIVEKAPVLSGGALNATSTVITPNQSIGFPVTYDTNAPAQYMIWSQEGSSANTVTLFALTNPLTTPQVQSIVVSVPTYTHPENPPQMGTSTTTTTFEQRFWSCVYRNGSLWATHHVGNPVKQRWYEFDMAGWPSGGTPTLVQSGEVDPGPSIRTYFGSIWADALGNMALVYARSSQSEFISMERTFRAAGDPLGTTQAPVRVIDSTSPNNTTRWGDYSAIVDDPIDPATFWAHAEYRTSSWRTRVARFGLCAGGTSNYCVTSPNSVGLGALMGSSGSTSVAANDLVLQAAGCPPLQNGTFFYGPMQTQSVFGNGNLCVAGGFFRLSLTSTDGGGSASTALDITNPPTMMGQITAGSTWNFQFWYRDPAGGGSFFNLSDGLAATFCP